MSQNPFELAGASQEPDRPVPNPDTAREVFPVRFEKDYLDLRGREQVKEGPLAPKSSSARESVEQQGLPTGLEDVSEEDLENPALTSAERVKKTQPSKIGEPGSQSS